MINKNELQYVLEKDACKKNGGMCESYNYCKFCAEPKRIFRKSDTPCADAYIDMKDITKMLKNHIKDKEYIEVNTKKIEIPYDSEKDLERILEILGIRIEGL